MPLSSPVAFITVYTPALRQTLSSYDDRLEDKGENIIYSSLFTTNGSTTRKKE